MSQLPTGFASFLENQLGQELAARALAGYEAPTATSLRLNPHKVEGEAIHSPPVPWCLEGRVLASRPVFTLDPWWHSGAYYVQEASSMAAAQALAAHLPEASTHVLDLCAAPGGKSTHLAALLPEGCLLVTNEVIRSRTGRLQENLERWGLPGHALTSLDPAQIGQQAEALFDAILIDAPCSGEGLFRKDADAANEWSEAHVQLCHARQVRIVEDVWPALRPGGVLVYSTCTLNRLEDEGTVTAILGLGAEPLPLPFSLATYALADNTGHGMRFIPGPLGNEGFYLAAFRKAGEHFAGPRKLARRDMERLVAPKAAHLEALQRWLLQASKQSTFLYKNTLRHLPEPYRRPALELLATLPIVSLGIPVATPSGHTDVLPDPGLATLAGLQPAPAFSDLELNLPAALAYLRRDEVRGLVDAPPGWHRACYQGQALGWLKAIQGGRVNNHYPQQRRILMELPGIPTWTLSQT